MAARRGGALRPNIRGLTRPTPIGGGVENIGGFRLRSNRDGPPKSEASEALAGATEAKIADEGHRHGREYHPGRRAATLIRRFGLAEALAGDVALLAWGAGR